MGRAPRSMVAALLRGLTPLGRGVLVGGVVVTGVAVWLNWQEFVLLGVVCLGLVMVGVGWQAVPGAPTATLVLQPRRCVEGSAPATAKLTFQAGAAPMLSPRVTVPVGRHEAGLRLPTMSPFAHHTEDVPLPALPRGSYTVGPVSYEKTDPVGLVTRRLRSGSSLELLVAPRVIDLSVFAGGLVNDLDGATSQQVSMSDLAFHALREYVPGDDLRHVHWRSSAKAGELLVRQYHETRRGQVSILLDPCRSSYRRLRDFELAVSVATSIALRAVRDDFDTYLRCGEHSGRGRHSAAMTDAACRFRTADDDTYLHESADASRSVHGSGLLVQVTGSARAPADLLAAAGRFGQEADRLVVRADSESAPLLADSTGLRELTVPDLARLRDLMARGLR